MEKQTKPKGRTKDLVVMNLENETLIYDLSENKAFCLNRTSAKIWELCDGTNSIAEMGNLLSRDLKTPVNKEIIRFALDELGKNDLLENSENHIDHFSGLKRREIVKKIGLASMIALPIVSSVVAPNAVMAGSCLNTELGVGSPPGPFFVLNPQNVFCADPTSRANQEFCEERGFSLCRSCLARYNEDCIDRAADSIFSCSCL